MLRNVFIASLAAGVARAASVCSSSITVATQADLDSFASCTTLTGSLNINTQLMEINIPNLKSITGDLTVSGNLIQTLAAPLLNSIGGQFNMTELIVLSTCSFPVLTTVGSIQWLTLPALEALSFGPGITTAADVFISDTRLSSLDGINLMTVGTFNINNNRQLTEITVQLANVTDALSVDFNGQGVSASFPNLMWANNATFQDCKSVLMPSLQSINGSLGFINNTLATFMAPNLTTVGEAVSFVDNTALTNVSMPKLVSVGGSLQLANNTELLNIDGFPLLKTVGGAVDFSGNFTNATLPSLSDVKGGFNLQTSASNFDCSVFQSEKGNIIEGNAFFCSGAVADPSTAGTTPTPTSGGSGSTSSPSHSSGAAIENVANTYGMFAAAAFIGALVM